MPDELAGRTIAIMQARHAEVMAELVRKRGGRPLVAPTMREEDIREEEPLRNVLEKAIAGRLDMVVFQTGVGTRRLFEHADQDVGNAFRQVVARSIVVERGPKPLAVLLKNDVRVDRKTSEPHTTHELIQILPDVAGKTILVQHHGARNDALVEYLQRAGAEVLEATTYHWALPDDLEPVRSFARDLEAGLVDVTVFTSLSQVENLLRIAELEGWEHLEDWLRERTLIASVGPTTSGALREHGLEPAVEPDHPKMVPLVDAVCRRLASAAR